MYETLLNDEEFEPEQVKRRYELKVYDEDNEELVFEGEYPNDEIMQENLRKVDTAFDRYEQDLTELKYENLQP